MIVNNIDNAENDNNNMNIVNVNNADATVSNKTKPVHKLKYVAEQELLNNPKDYKFVYGKYNTVVYVTTQDNARMTVNTGWVPCSDYEINTFKMVLTDLDHNKFSKYMNMCNVLHNNNNGGYPNSGNTSILFKFDKRTTSIMKVDNQGTNEPDNKSPQFMIKVRKYDYVNNREVINDMNMTEKELYGYFKRNGNDFRFGYEIKLCKCSYTNKITMSFYFIIKYMNIRTAAHKKYKHMAYSDPEKYKVVTSIEI